MAGTAAPTIRSTVINGKIRRQALGYSCKLLSLLSVYTCGSNPQRLSRTPRTRSEPPFDFVMGRMPHVSISDISSLGALGKPAAE